MERIAAAASPCSSYVAWGPRAKPGGRTFSFSFLFATLDQDEPVKWEMLTCLHLGVVHPVSDLFLTDEVIYNLHPDWRL